MREGCYRGMPAHGSSPFQTGTGGWSGTTGMLATNNAIMAARELSMIAGGSPVMVRQAARKASAGMEASVLLEGMG